MHVRVGLWYEIQARRRDNPLFALKRAPPPMSSISSLLLQWWGSMGSRDGEGCELEVASGWYTTDPAQCTISLALLPAEWGLLSGV
jgi:hypothetical protein